MSIKMIKKFKSLKNGDKVYYINLDEIKCIEDLSNINIYEETVFNIKKDESKIEFETSASYYTINGEDFSNTSVAEMSDSAFIISVSKNYIKEYVLGLIMDMIDFSVQKENQYVNSYFS